MYFTTKRKLMADNEMLRAKIRSMEQQLSSANVLLSTQKRDLERCDKEIEALSQTIDGMEKDLGNKKRYIKISDQERKQVSQRERELRVKYEKLAEDMRRIGRDGLCCMCTIGASPEACGCTCCFEYDGELPDKNRNRSDGPSGTPAPTKAQDNIAPKNSTERYFKV